MNRICQAPCAISFEMGKLRPMAFKKFLELEFLEWQRKVGARKTVAEFADFLGVSQSTVSAWWNQTRSPEGENLRKLANKLGLEVYDVLGLPRPDEDLHFISQNWDKISPAERRAMREQAEKYVSDDEAKRIRKSRRAGAST